MKSCFFWLENRKSDESLMTVSSKRISDLEFDGSFNAWKKTRQNIDYLRLSCAATENRAFVCIILFQVGLHPMGRVKFSLDTS